MSRSGAVERAIAALRTGRAVRIEAGEPFAFVSIETATPELLRLLDPESKAPLLLSGRRAAALSLANEREAADPLQPVHEDPPVIQIILDDQDPLCRHSFASLTRRYRGVV